MNIGDKIKLKAKTNRAKSILNRDGAVHEVLGFSMDVLFDTEKKDWINIQSIDNDKNGRWVQRHNDANFDWEII